MIYALRYRVAIFAQANKIRIRFHTVVTEGEVPVRRHVLARSGKRDDIGPRSLPPSWPRGFAVCTAAGAMPGMVVLQFHLRSPTSLLGSPDTHWLEHVSSPPRPEAARRAHGRMVRAWAWALCTQPAAVARRTPTPSRAATDA